MEISDEYQGKRYAGVIYDGDMYRTITKNDSQALNMDLNHLTELEDIKIIQRFSKINENASLLIDSAVKHMNRGERVDLGTLLEDDD
ncbi:MAG: hypothetical protein WD876_02475 [Candidatus Pacearchaeota archaeon]